MRQYGEPCSALHNLCNPFLEDYIINYYLSSTQYFYREYQDAHTHTHSSGNKSPRAKKMGYRRPDVQSTFLTTVTAGIGALRSEDISSFTLDGNRDLSPLVAHVQTADFQAQDQRQETVHRDWYEEKRQASI